MIQIEGGQLSQEGITCMSARFSRVSFSDFQMPTSRRPYILIHSCSQSSSVRYAQLGQSLGKSFVERNIPELKPIERGLVSPSCSNFETKSIGPAQDDPPLHTVGGRTSITSPGLLDFPCCFLLHIRDLHIVFFFRTCEGMLCF